MHEKQDRKNGLTRAEWLKLYDDVDWKGEIVKTCHAIALCSDAPPGARMAALDVWGKLASIGLVPLIPPDDRPYPQIVRDVQLDLVRGRAGKGPVDERLRGEMIDRLDGVMSMMGTISGFLDHGAVHALAEAIMQGESRQSAGGN